MKMFKLTKTTGFYLLFLIILSSCTLNDNGNKLDQSPAIVETPSPIIEIPTLVINLEITSTPTATFQNEEENPENILTPLPNLNVCLNAGGHLSVGSLKTENWEYPLDFIVYTPPCYFKERGRDYPVLYLFHGKTYRQDQWINLGGIEVVDRLVAAGEMEPHIIVMPRDRVWTQPSEDIFGKVVMDLLLPYIDETYRTKNDREFRAVGGLSRGGAWALYLGLKNWDQFSIIGLVSPSLFWEHGGMVTRWIEAVPPDMIPRIFMDVRKYEPWEIENSVYEIEESLILNNIPHEFYQMEGYHREEFWTQDIETYMRFYSQDW